jgi:4-amino-4-deoxy-L-arabinose transferase-like glycosyltransferase
LIIVVSGLIYAAGLNPLLPLNEDTSVYINLAQSLGAGKGFIYTAESVAKPGNQYPPVYPALISLFVRFFPGNFFILKLFSVFLTVVLIISIAFYIARFFDEKSTLLIIALLSLNPQMSLYSRSILTEIPFTLFSISSIYFLARYQQEPGIFNRYFFISAVAIAFACYTRLIGMCIIMTAVIFFIIKKDLRKAFASVLFSLTMLPWIAANLVFGKSAYTAEFGGVTHGAADFIHRWVYNLLATIAKEFPDIFFYPWLNGIDSNDRVFIFKLILGCVLTVLLILGFILKAKKEGFRLWDMYVLIYFFLVYLSWTHHGARYLVTILLFLTYYLTTAIRTLLKRKAVFFLAAIFFISGIAANVWLIWQDRLNPLDPKETSFVAAVDWVKDNVPVNSIVLSRRFNWVYVYTGGIKGLRLLRNKDTKKQYEYIVNNKADFIIIDQNKIYRDDSRDYLVPLVRDYQSSFQKVYESVKQPKTLIYKVIK